MVLVRSLLYIDRNTNILLNILVRLIGRALEPLTGTIISEVRRILGRAHGTGASAAGEIMPRDLLPN